MIKINVINNNGRLKSSEANTGGAVNDMQDASLVLLPSLAQSRSEKLPASEQGLTQRNRMVPVISMEGMPLMPSKASRVRRWIKNGKAIERWRKGIFYVQLTTETGDKKQNIVVGVDPGSKKEAFTVKSNKYTYLNIQTDAITWIKEKVILRKNARRRRRKSAPYRKCRQNRSIGGLSPSIKARWQWKLNIIKQLVKIYPITDVIIEDVKAKTKGKRKWDVLFSSIEIGKNWFYTEIQKMSKLHIVNGYDTYLERKKLGLKKSSNKLLNTFKSHCVDSWVIANKIIKGHTCPDNIEIFCIEPIEICRRQLHRFNPSKGNIRDKYGGTNSLGLIKGSLVFHKKYGISYVGGTRINKLGSERITLHDLKNGNRLSRDIQPKDCIFYCYKTWKNIGVFK